MRLDGDQIRLSASDLMRFQACQHAAALDLRHLRGEVLEPAEDDPGAVLLQAMGDAHEEKFLHGLRDAGYEIASIDKDAMGFRQAIRATAAALGDGPAYIYQGALAKGPWGGYSDFLERVARSSRLGEHSYEVIDTKLKRSPDPKHILQLALYSDLLDDLQGLLPEQIHIVLGDNRRVSLRLSDYLAYARHARERLETFVAAPWPTRPEPVAACGLCRWRDHCARQWDEEDALSLVAGISKGQRAKLETAGVSSIGELARHSGRVPGLADTTLNKLRGQAKLQHARRQGAAPHFELRTPEDGRGLLRLPPPSPQDLYFDIEGDPYYEGGLEYLFGVYSRDGKNGRFEAVWAHDRDAEREAVRGVLSTFREHLKCFPDAHIYHYGHYEPVALKRLCSLHGVSEADLDHLLREQRFVDLYRVVQQGLFASEPGYSLKDIEVFYLEKRADDVTSAMDSVIAYEEWRTTRDPQVLENIRLYNEVDCRSTAGLHNWLVHGVRPAELPWFEAESTAEDSTTRDTATLEAEADRQALRQQVEAAAGRIWEDVAGLIFELAWFHQREDKPKWWEMFDRAGRDADELVDDLDSLGSLTAISGAEPVARSQSRRYRFPAQETKMRTGSIVKEQYGLADVTILDLDLETLEAEVKFGPKAGDPPDSLNLIPGGPINNKVLKEAVRRVVDSMVAGDGRYQAIECLLREVPPRIDGSAPGEPIVDASKDIVAEAVRAIRSLDASYMPVQGPPGTGKTYVSSHAILDLVRDGKRVAVSSNSHKAINNLLEAVAARAREAGVTLSAVKKISQDADAPEAPEIESVMSNSDPRLASSSLVGGTAWLFARPDHDQKFDYLFVDEAGQVSLANLLAMGTAAKNIVLVGDPMQLPQPIQGVHPGKTGLSALEYVLGEHATIPPDRGIFLPESRRMHPAICSYISELVYENRLGSDAGTAVQCLEVPADHPVLRPAGLRFVEVVHEGNSQSSPEEAGAIVELYQTLLGRMFTDRDGNKKPLGKEDILVVTPYNAQVNLLAQKLPHGARVGTVDKFQGQEAPVCLISMATSSGDDLPRDIAFLFSVNRLNVAISRAQALSVVFASPRLLEVPCSTIEEMRLVNALCAVRQHSLTLDQRPQN